MNQPLHRRAQRFFTSLNAPLLVGIALAVLMVGALAAAPLLTPHDPIRMRVPGSNDSQAFPAPPGTPAYPLGTDVEGRDIWARLLYGGRSTLLICAAAAVVRVLLGALVGMLAGWYPRVRWALNSLISAWSAIPPIFLALFVLEILTRIVFQIPRASIKTTSALFTDAIIFTIFLSLTGWPEIAVRCQAATIGLSRRPFVEAAYVIGLRPVSVLWRHVLPNVRDVLLPEAANALAGALLLLAELGFLQVFIGGGTEDIAISRYQVPLYPEWGSMVALGLRQRNQGYWILIEPILAFTLTIVAFSLLAEGLRRRQNALDLA